MKGFTRQQVRAQNNPTTTYHNLNIEAKFFQFNTDNMRNHDFIALEIMIFIFLRKKH